MRRTGLKILYRKIKNFVKYPYRYGFGESIKFPGKGQSRLKQLFWLQTLLSELKDANLDKTLGFLHSRPHPMSEKVWEKLLPFNTNNLGDWTGRKHDNLYGTGKSEKELILKMIDLLGGKTGDWVGYVTSGATEANIFSVWAGRNYLNSKRPAKTCLILSQFTHYSIKKAANIAGLPTFELKINRRNWKPDPLAFERKIIELEKKGFRNFLLPLTLGYTQTGANDDYPEIIKQLKELKNKLNIKTYFWIDAAINGLVLPFTQKMFYPLKSPELSTFILDFHKTGMCPIPSGLILYRRSLKKLVNQKVQYLDRDDNTVLGSRPGASAASMLAVVNALGKRGFKRLISRSQLKKADFISKIRKEKLDVEIVDNGGISVSLVAKSPLPPNFIQTYGLFAKKWTYNFETGSEKLYIYKLNFLFNAANYFKPS